MANIQLDVDIHQNTIGENELILLKLHGRSNKIDNKTWDEWKKLFDKLNNYNDNNNTTGGNRRKMKKSAKTCTAACHNQTSVEPIYGPIRGFPSGYWWGIRMDCSRDQVHSPFDKNVQQGPFGVASICTSHLNTTNDVDLGTLLTFTGREYTSGNMDDPLMHNYHDNIPLRLIRSYNLVNKFAPKTGYRYDGLYIVISSWIGVSFDSKKYQKFALARLNYQEPPPWPLQAKRTSQRISSSALRNSIARAQGCGSLRCHMYSCQTQEPEKKKKKIIHHHQQHTATTIDINSANIIKSTEIQRDVNESTIVMRHVSKKCDLIGLGAGYNMNVNGVESPIQIGGNCILPCSPPKPTSCKLQNTNISIRTELYDSSPNTQQDIKKKTTPVTICRIYKANLLPATKMISSHPPNTLGTMNLNPLDPYITDKVNRKSQIQSLSGIHKVSDSPPIANASNCTFDTTTIIDNFGIRSKTSTQITDVSNLKIRHQYNYINNADNSTPETNENNKELRRDIGDNLDENLTGVKRHVVNSRRNSNTSSSSTDSLIKKLQLPEAVVTIETMTPEQLLNLIVKKRYNPTGKLLIGSIIGLPNETFTQANESYTKSTINPGVDLDINDDISSQKIQPCGTDTKTHNFDDTFHESRSTLSAVLPEKIEITKVDRKLRFTRLKHSRITKSLDLIEQSNIIKDKNSSQRLNKAHTNDKFAQPFSKSTTMKKRRGELANLMIDANFSTKIHSHAIQTRTMSRRLRSPTIILRKRKEFKDFITNYTKFESSKKTKRLKSGKKTNISINRQLHNNKCGTPSTKNIHCDFTKSIEESGQMNYESEQKSSVSLKEEINSNEIEDCNSRMVDAMTQCSLQNDTILPDDKKSYGNNFNSKSVKIEWIDLVDSDDDIKFENYNNETTKKKAIRYDNKVPKFSIDSKISRTTSTKIQITSNRNPTIPSDTFQNKCFSINGTINSLSAFAPVNLPDGDLRIARLRSIGFKPIGPCLHHNNETLHICNEICSNVESHVEPMVIRRDVDEQYNKYTSEENNIVGYMDQELHYQDIEADASGAQQKKSDIILSNCKCTKKIKRKNTVKNSKPMKRTNRRLRDKSCKQQINKNNVNLGEEMSPWPGWNSYAMKR